jgi:hypothetical protein
MTAVDLGDTMPARSSTTLQPNEIDAPADYVTTKLKGAGPVTRKQCPDYFGGGTARCHQYSAR